MLPKIVMNKNGLRFRHSEFKNDPTDDPCLGRPWNIYRGKQDF